MARARLAIVLAIYVTLALAQSESVVVRPIDGDIHDPAMVDRINALNPGWVAGYNERFDGMTWGDARELCGTYLDHDVSERRKDSSTWSTLTAFDARNAWPGCIHPIRDQELCGGCWAFASTEVLSDRMCITGGPNVILSPQYLISCDTGPHKQQQGCAGGMLNLAWAFLSETGGLADICVPFASGGGTDPDVCTNNTCVPAQPGVPARYWAKLPANPEEMSVAEIQSQLVNNGPVSTSFMVYSDFTAYTSGVYQKTPGATEVGGHSVKIVGWNVTSSNVPYWIVANSWGPTWGINGYFWILRGADEVGIESGAFVGTYSHHNGTTICPPPAPPSSASSGGGGGLPPEVQVVFTLDPITAHILYALLGVTGLVFLFAGQRFYPTFTLIFSLLFGSVTVLILLAFYTHLPLWGMILISLLVGLILAALSSVPVIGSFLAGVCLATVLASMVLTLQPVATACEAGRVGCNTTLIIWYVVCAAAVAAIRRGLVFPVTAITGAFLLMMGIDYYFVVGTGTSSSNSGYFIRSSYAVPATLGILSGDPPEPVPVVDAQYWLIAFGLICVAGLLIQIFLTREKTRTTPEWKDIDPNGPSQEEVAAVDAQWPPPDDGRPLLLRRGGYSSVQQPLTYQGN